MIQKQSNLGPTIAFVAPFAVFVGVMTIEKALSIPPQVAYPARFLLTLATVLLCSRRYLSFQFSNLWASVGIGIGVFVVWVAPDLLFGYRHSILFQNQVMGTVESSVPPELRQVAWFVFLRTASATALVPIVEELFWRGWLMRWLIDSNFLSVPLGRYQPAAFWITAILFASEHGPYWEVGLLAGVIYNWWMVRTRNLADCVLAHAVTNGVLCVYVVVTGRWQYLL